MADIHWFNLLCIIASSFFTLCVIVLTVLTLIFRSSVIRKYDRGKSDG